MAPKEFKGLMNYLTRPSEDKKRQKGYFETNDPKEAAREIIKRVIPIDQYTFPITSSVNLGLGPDLDQVNIGSELDVGGGTLSVGGGIKGDEKGFGIGFRKEFEDGGRIKLQGGTDPKTGQGFQPGNPGNIQSLEERNIKQTQSKNERVIKFKELVKAGDTPNQAKNKVIKEFKLKRSKTAGTPRWMMQGRDELISEGFDYVKSKPGPENVGGKEKAQKKRGRFVGNLEERLKKIKTKTGLGKAYEIAHTANIFQAKKLGIDYPIDALAVQTQNVNNKVAEQLNDELKPLYKQQLKLFNQMKNKTTPALQKALDNINFKISEIVATGGSQGSKAANVLKPIIVDPTSLKGKILDLGFDTTTEVMAPPGATTKSALAGTTEDIMSRANVIQKLKPFINLVPYGPARKFLKMFAKGGRASFQSGTIPGGYTDDAYKYLREMDDEIFNSYKKYRAGGGKMKYGPFAYNAKRMMFGAFGVGQKKFAEGGGVKSGPPPESGPTPHGLPSLMKRGMKI
jgi:hypothetical protein